MKKIIITVMAIATMISLVSCKGESRTTVTRYTEGTNYVTVDTYVDDEHTGHSMIFDSGLTVDFIESDEESLEEHEAGIVSKEYYDEVAFNSLKNLW